MYLDSQKRAFRQVEKMKAEDERITHVKPDISWLMLLVLMIVMIGTHWLQSYTVLYTEGEVAQGLLQVLEFLIPICGLLGFFRRRLAA